MRGGDSRGLLGQASRDVMVRLRSRRRLGSRQAFCDDGGTSGNFERKVDEAVEKGNEITELNEMTKDALIGGERGDLSMRWTQRLTQN